MPEFSILGSLVRSGLHTMHHGREGSFLEDEIMNQKSNAWSLSFGWEKIWQVLGKKVRRTEIMSSNKF